MKLFINALTKFICGILLVGLLIFLPAGTVSYIGGWIFSGLLFIPIMIMGIASYGLYAEVMRENAYLSRTIKVSENQKVISTGLYGIVRHPMYAATILMFLTVPIILGSWWSLLIFLGYPVVIAVRIINEEKILTAQLEGYEDYKKKVKFRLIPWMW